MTDGSRPDRCDQCRALVGKGRYEKPHSNLRLVKQGEPYGHMFGGGVDSTYLCEACGTAWFHSTDKADFGWQIEMDD